MATPALAAAGETLRPPAHLPPVMAALPDRDRVGDVAGGDKNGGEV